MPDARAMIDALELQPHPEGGWFRETWRQPAPGGEGRGLATAILFLLEAGQRSHWHRVDAAELWLFQAGAPLSLSTPSGTVRLGPDPLAGHVLQHLIAPHEWQAAEGPEAGWSLVACVVAPAFDFAGFELAPPGWTPPGWTGAP